MKFIEVTEIDERGIRRLAQSRGTTVTRTGINSYVFNGVAVSDDEVWGMLQNMPQTHTLDGKNRQL
jgi:hypothetical protein